MSLTATAINPALDAALTVDQALLALPGDEDSPDSQLPFGIDLSRYNTSEDGKKRVNFDAIQAHSPFVAFIGVRAGISWGYQDPWFNYYFTEAQRINRIRFPYHVLYPGEDAARQMDNFFRILGDINLDTNPLVLDLELDHGQTVSKITQTTINCINIIYRRTNRIPFIYSRALWVNRFLMVSALPPVHWWLAQYRFSLPYPLYTPEYSPPPSLPTGVNTWHIHQTSQRGKSIGAPALYYMDYNRFNGSIHDLTNFIYGAAQPVPITCPIDNLPCTGDKTETPQATPSEAKVNRTQLKLTPSWLIHKQNLSLLPSINHQPRAMQSPSAASGTSHQLQTTSHQLPAKVHYA